MTREKLRYLFQLESELNESGILDPSTQKDKPRMAEYEALEAEFEEWFSAIQSTAPPEGRAEGSD